MSGTAGTKRRRGTPTRLEIELAANLRDAADDLTKATNYAETYVARVELGNAIRALQAWAMAGRPTGGPA